MTRELLAFILAASASAQTGENAGKMLDAISKTIRSAESVRVAGTVRRTITGENTQRQVLGFTLGLRGPLHARFDALGSKPMILICDGASFWDYSGRSNSFTKAVATPEVCEPAVARWENLTQYLVDAKFTGRDRSDFEGNSQDCDLIEATYESPRPLTPLVPSAGRLTRTFCVDITRHIILRETIDSPMGADPTAGTRFALEVTYSEIDLNPILGDGYFRFDPPPGSKELAASSQTTPPQIISKHEPKYTSEALKAKLEGTVTLSLTVGADGVPKDIKVIRGLGLGLDERAVEAVQQWRFKPATKGGEAVDVVAQVQVNFALRHDRP